MMLGSPSEPPDFDFKSDYQMQDQSLGENHHQPHQVNQLLMGIETNDTTNPSNINLTNMLASIIESNARLHAKLEYSISLQEQILAKIDLPNVNLEEFQTIDTIEEVFEFESKLGNEQYVRYVVLYKNHLTITKHLDLSCTICLQQTQLYPVCGPTSGRTGDNVSYKIVDALFTRRFFTLVSWTGQSRSQQIKENFSRFVKTLRLFHHLVNRCDPSYTKVHVKMFFRKIIDNSKRRSMEQRRAPATKNRRLKSFSHNSKPSTTVFPDGGNDLSTM